MSSSHERKIADLRALKLGDLLEEFDERLGSRREPEVLTLTEKMGFVSQRERFKKRLAIADTSDYRLIGLNDIAFNPYLLRAGAIAQNTDWKEAIISPVYPTFHVRNGYNPRFVNRLLCRGFLRSRYEFIGSVPRKRRTAVKDFLNLEIPPQPSLAEQEQIVRLLDEADELRKLSAQADRLTSALVPALFQEMFGGSGSDAKRWPVKTLEQLAERLHQGINTAAEKVQYHTSGYPILQAKHVTSGRIEIDDARFVSAADFAKYKDRYRPDSGNILFTNIGTIGKSVVVDRATDFLVAWNIFLIALHPDISPIFVNAYLQLLDKRGYFTGRNTGSATQFVSKSQMQSIEVPVPPLSLQNEFSQRVTRIHELGTAQVACRKRIDDLLQSMLHSAFNGEL